MSNSIKRGSELDPAPILVIVDDEPDLRRLLTVHFAARGYSVVGAGTGLNALDVIRIHHPDAILLDLCLPDVGGLAVLVELRTADPDCRVIVITANGDDQVARQALQLGAREFVQKPFELSDLSEIVAMQVAAKRGKAPPSTGVFDAMKEA